jgi:branched-chain amino acid transport system substrate-binding protein
MRSRTDAIYSSLVLFLVVLTFSCTPMPTGNGAYGVRSGADPDSVLSMMRAAADSSLSERVVAGARFLIDRYPDLPGLDEAYYLASSSLYDLKRYGEAVRFCGVMKERYPLSRFLEKSLLVAAESYLELGDYERAIDAAVELGSSGASPEMKSEAARVTRIAVSRMGPGEIEAMIRKHPESGFADDISLDVARREFARGEYEKAYSILADLIYRNPRHPRAAEIRRLLRAVSAKRTVGPNEKFVDPFKIGAVFPVTGPASFDGLYFSEGLSLALEEFNDTSYFQVNLVRADSKGNPFDALRAVRKLINEDGVIAVLGSLRTVPTITAAVESNAWGVPFLSPVVSSEEIRRIGDWVFETRVPGYVEATCIAKAAVSSLLIQRIAILSPVAGDGRSVADFFAREVERLGGEVVSKEFFEEGATDFKEQLENIRESVPEALFIPASPEELILILPQLRYYDMEVQLLGLSEWNSDKLMRIAREEMEGAVFPLQSYHGEDRSVYEHFQVVARERFGEDVNPLVASGYFSMRLLLKGLREGVSDREQAKEYLFSQLYGDPEIRLREADFLTLLTVHDGKIVEFEGAPRTLPTGGGR